MKLTNTACLAALLLACPLATPAVASLNKVIHYCDEPNDSGKVVSSGYKEEGPAGSFYYLVVSRACSKDANVEEIESSNNEGIYGDGVTLEAWGAVGNAYDSYGIATVQANSNTLTIKKGFILTGDFITCAVAQGNADVTTKLNNATIDKDFEGNISNLYVALAQYEYKTSAEQNKYSITTSDNELKINNLGKIKIDNIYIGYARDDGYDSNVDENRELDFIATDNKCELVLGNNSQLYQVYSGYSESYLGNTEASKNSLHITSGKIAPFIAYTNAVLCGGYALFKIRKKSNDKS